MARFLFVLIAAALLNGQEPSDTIRVSVTLVQVDAVVLDAKGRQITDLKKEDFEVFDNGKPRVLTQFSYESLASVSPSKPGVSEQVLDTTSALSPARRQDVSRTIAILVDDLRMSFEGVNHTRRALKKFVDEQVQRGDLVAVISTSGGVGTLQQFTTDKRFLHAAIERVHFLLAGGGSGGPIKALGGGGQEIDSPETAYMRQRRFSTGTMGALRLVIDGMKGMPGRKSLIVFSESLAISRDQKDETELAAGELFQIAGEANGATVVIHGIDPRGLAYTEIQAQDDTSLMEQADVRQALEDRREKLRAGQGGLRLLASETGGRVHLNHNDLNMGLRQVLEEQSGYYLLGFERGDDNGSVSNTKEKYAGLLVRVKKPGLSVRYRKGYMGGDASPEAPPSDPDQRLAAALRSPFTGEEIELRMTAGLGLTGQGQSAIQALIHIAGEKLTFREADQDGYRSADLRLAALSDGGSKKSDAAHRTYKIRVKSEALEKVRKEGFVYELQHPVKPGAYQLRVAVVDTLSGRTGSARRFLEIPDLRKGELAMSNIAMSAGDWRETLRNDSPAPENDNFALRIFERQRPFSYGVTLYNAPLNKKTGLPDVELQPVLIRDSGVIWEGKPISLAIQPGRDARRIPAGGMLTLGTNTTPGRYVLVLKAVTIDRKKDLFTQSIDFDLR